MATPTVSIQKRPITWMHLVTFAIVTGVCTVLAIFAVIAAPVPPAPGVSGLYIAAAVYVPVALWFGMWGALAGYASCVLLGMNLGFPLPFVLWWSVADFIEGLVPLVVFRFFKVEPDFSFKNRRAADLILILLVLDLVFAGLCTATPAIGNAMGTVGILGLERGLLEVVALLVAIVLMVVTIVVTKSRTWTFYILSGILGAGVLSGLVGASSWAVGELQASTLMVLAILGPVFVVLTVVVAYLAQANPKLTTLFYAVALGVIVLAPVIGLILFASSPSYAIAFFGWTFGDIIVLSTVGTMLLTILTPFIKRTQIYIHGWLS